MIRAIYVLIIITARQDHPSWNDFVVNFLAIDYVELSPYASSLAAWETWVANANLQIMI